MVSEVRRSPVHAMPNIRSQALLLAAIDLMFRLAPQDAKRAKDVLDDLHQRAPRSVAPLAWLSRWHLFRVVQGWAVRPDEDGLLGTGLCRACPQH